MSKRSFVVPACPHCKVKLGTSRPHRKNCKLGVTVGRNYDNYKQSKDDLDQARRDLAVAQGGSTEGRMSAAQLDLYVAQERNDMAWEDFQNNPEG